MSESTLIDTKGVELYGKKDKKMRTVNFYDNLKIEYLPIKVDEIFPNLNTYSAGFCSIREISQENFKGLTKLRALFLQHNKINRILSDTFQDLKLLQAIELGKVTSNHLLITKLIYFLPAL